MVMEEITAVEVEGTEADTEDMAEDMGMAPFRWTLSQFWDFCP